MGGGVDQAGKEGGAVEAAVEAVAELGQVAGTCLLSKEWLVSDGDWLTFPSMVFTQVRPESSRLPTPPPMKVGS